LRVREYYISFLLSFEAASFDSDLKIVAVPILSALFGTIQSPCYALFIQAMSFPFASDHIELLGYPLHVINL